MLKGKTRGSTRTRVENEGGGTREKEMKKKKGFVEAGRAARNETTLDFNGRRTLPLAKFEVPGNSINGYSVCTRLLAAV